MTVYVDTPCGSGFDVWVDMSKYSAYEDAIDQLELDYPGCEFEVVSFC